MTTSGTFLRPGHLHAASKVLSASTEAGLSVAPPVPSSANKGQLRPRTSGTPLDATVIDVLHRTGGNPVGYSANSVGYGAGAAVVHKKSTDTASQYRGYIDTPYLVRVEYPVPYDANGHGYPSTPRQLANGDLGFLIGRGSVFGSLTYFHRVDEAGTVTRTPITTSFNTGTGRPELIVMPSGRLLAFVNYSALSIYRILTFCSDDNGATWSQLAEFAYIAPSSLHDRICLEYVDDLITGIIADPDGDDVDVIVSRDGGCSFTLVARVEDIGEKPSVCVTTTGKLLLSACNFGVAGVGVVYPIAPGGGLGTAIQVTENCYHEQPIMCRDDGTVWLWRFGPTSTIGLDAAISVSLNGGITWSDPTDESLSTTVLNAEITLLARVYEGVSVGMWNGRAIMLAQQNSAQGAGTNGQIHMLTWGGWESVTEVRRGAEGQTYDHTYLPAELPEDIGWTRVNTAGGATVTNRPWLRFVTTGTTNTYYTSQAGFYGNAIGESHRSRFRTRIVSGGSRSTSVASVGFYSSDGTNEQSALFRFASTGVTVTDGAGNQLAAVTADLTGWCDWLFAHKHDITAGVGRCAIYYRLQGAALWVEAASNVSIAEVVGTRERIEIGGDKLAVTTWDLAFIEAADDDNGLDFGFVNPTQLVGRPLTSAADWYLTNGIRMGGRNGGAVPGDSYTITPAYNYGKESIWRELRPSKKVHSAGDNATWSVVFDAGLTGLFKGDLVALFGTNFRTAALEFNTADSWGAPAATVALDATVASFTIGAGVRGPGYFGPTASPNWRPGQFKSDGTSHRWFVSTTAGAYEITDNDEDRLFVDGFDFAAASGTAYVYGDRMAAATTFKQYRFMRLSLTAQQTPAIDDCYHVGTLLFDKGFVPSQIYDHGFIDRVELNVELFESDGGFQSHAEIGPRKHTLAIQWPPVAVQSASTDVEARIRDFYSSLAGGVFAFWRDTSDVSALGLYRFRGEMYQATNVRGEGATALTRIDQLVLEEVL